MPTMPVGQRRRRMSPVADQKAQDERNIRKMEQYYTDREEAMSPSEYDRTGDDSRESPARQDYFRIVKRLRPTGRVRGR